MLCMQWNFRGKQQQPPPVIGFENSVCNLEAMLVKKIHMIYENLSNKCKNIIKDRRIGGTSFRVKMQSTQF